VKPPTFDLAAQALFGQVYIVEFEALQRSSTRTALQWVSPWGMYCWGEIPSESADPGSPVTFRYSDTGYISPPTGILPNTLFEGRVSQALRMTRTLPVVPESARRVTIDIGAIELINVDGTFDASAENYANDGRPIRVLLGLDSQEYGEFTAIFTGRMTVLVSDFDKITVEARDQSYLLEVPLLKATYGGGGGADGTTSLAGKPKPCCFGEVTNVTPVFVDPSNLVYQFHFRQAQSVDGVYDRGAPLIFSANYATFDALTAASISAGHYATCLQFGLIRTGSTPSFLTADVKGDAAGGYVNSTSAIAQRMIAGIGPYGPDNLDTAVWNAFELAVPQAIGWYRTEQILISDAVSEIVGGCGGYWGASFGGLIGANILSAPDGANVSYYFTASDVRDIARLPPAAGTFPPRWRQRVGWARNWTPMSGNDIADNPALVSDARRQFLNEEYRFASATDADVQTEFLTALDPDPLLSLFAESAGAQARANDLLDLLSSPRQTLRITVGLIGYIPPLGSTVNLTHPRVSNNQGWNARLIDTDIDAADGQITLTLWG
jgi:hypothetical protein